MHGLNPPRWRWLAILLPVLPALALARPARAQTPTPAGEASEEEKTFKSIQWTKGPAKVQVGDQADMQVRRVSLTPVRKGRRRCCSSCATPPTAASWAS